MREYEKNGKVWTAEQREHHLKLTKKAIADGVIPDSSKLPCEICGDTRRRHHYHCTDYDDTTFPSPNLHALCFKCHLALHSIERGTGDRYYWSSKSYFDNLRQALGGRRMPMPIPELGKEWKREDEGNETAD